MKFVCISANSFNELPATPMIISRMALLWLGDTILTLRLHPAASLTDHTCRVVFLYVGASRLFSGSVDNSINNNQLAFESAATDLDQLQTTETTSPDWIWLGGSCLREKKSAYQAMKKYINVQLAEDHVAHRQSRERSQICNQTTTELSIDKKDNIYDFEKTYEVRILQFFFLLFCDCS
uniref:Uncharacterized protein n=1 Tax=Brassica oleracea TaxID=3712 RepID=A0A3P6DD54_BRAOL|nr:unnamed protein product [Brassica oleracea]